ncbi:MAG: hypothetical protein UV72_C0023G0004 [Candidatus Giovannonibacteria bacterium GW2011_GWB1_43_13]|nr:MAG: hypothetical protein UV72_C0023G0004 [Candidatus Giovannonibacteria bacterium GW2011_GWB1_43_13]
MTELIANPSLKIPTIAFATFANGEYFFMNRLENEVLIFGGSCYFLN